MHIDYTIKNLRHNSLLSIMYDRVFKTHFIAMKISEIPQKYLRYKDTYIYALEPHISKSPALNPSIRPPPKKMFPH